MSTELGLEEFTEKSAHYHQEFTENRVFTHVLAFLPCGVFMLDEGDY